MKQLSLLRHAKSSWKDPTLADHDRPLNRRGRRAARSMADYLVSEGPSPALVLCSSSRRTRETLERIEAAVAGADVHIEQALYAASEGDLLARLRAIDDSVDSAMLIGHNPGLEDLASALAGSPLGPKFPTGALAVLEFDTTWRALAPGGATLAAFVKPRELERR